MPANPESNLADPPVHVASLGLWCLALLLFIAADVYLWLLEAAGAFAEFGLAISLAEYGLLAVWLVFARITMPLRISIATVLLLLAYCPDVIKGGLSQFAPAVWVLLVVAIPCAGARIAGRNIRKTVYPLTPCEPPSARSRAQFSLRQMFAWTTSVGVVAGVTRLAGPKFWWHGGDMFSDILGALVFGGLVLAAVWATLSAKPRFWRFAFCVFVAWSIGELIAYLAAPSVEVSRICAYLIADPIALLMVCGVLYLFRTVGWRFTRVVRAHPAPTIDNYSSPDASSHALEHRTA